MAKQKEIKFQDRHGALRGRQNGMEFWIRKDNLQAQDSEQRYFVTIYPVSKVKYLDRLLIQAAGKIKKAGTRTATPEAGVAALVAAGVINTPDYWLANYRTFPSLDALLCALGGAVK